jgi:spermidine/putrescine transport system ATP-binding protein
MNPAEIKAPSAEASIDGTVIGIEFVGSTQTVFVDLAGAGEFRAQKQQREIEALNLAPGPRVRLGWDRRHAWLLPEPA